MPVAPLAGSVDRNTKAGDLTPDQIAVAPLAGSVDRNVALRGGVGGIPWSLPSRGAWIEMRYSSQRRRQ